MVISVALVHLCEESCGTAAAEPQPKLTTEDTAWQSHNQRPKPTTEARRHGEDLENQEREIIEGRFTGEQKVMERYEQITN
jgi:hypothetical protein